MKKRGFVELASKSPEELTLEERLLTLWAFFHNSGIAISQGKKLPTDDLKSILQGIVKCEPIMQDIIVRHRKSLCDKCTHDEITFEEILDLYSGKGKRCPEREAAVS